ncbi:MAG TPA: hypothetical protein VHW90_05390 [Stellaceae bacterium]|jgi:hypothetical protein|nr:hypothetical protein [Stellaceae bacterium]
MVRRLIAAAFALLLSQSLSLAQPYPAYPNAPPRTYEQQSLPPIAPVPDAGVAVGAPPAMPPPVAPVPDASGVSTMAPPAVASAPTMSAPAMSAPADRVFCDQTVSLQLAAPDALLDRFRPFVGIFSDASWTPQLCAALIVQNVMPDGTASILYVFGPMGSGGRGTGGILRGTGVIREGELRFQNSDGSQFAFRPLYSDLDGRLTTPKGQSYETVFKRSF